ncbi:unnamed protein product [Leptosia nina]|uniref:Serpin domain-containing protein n=1 Tax=Leptosia nina TaxID=320188 RepID=A0AAV1JGH4_9NEOP
MNFYIAFCVLVSCAFSVDSAIINTKTNLNSELSNKIGNFSVDFIGRTLASEAPNANLIFSPITLWTVLGVIAEGAAGRTLKQVCDVLRIKPEDRPNVRATFRTIQKYLVVTTSTVELKKLNIMFVDKKLSPKKNFSNISSAYDVSFAPLNFSAPQQTADFVNQRVNAFTKGRITELVNSKDLLQSHMILTSALYFKGQWTYKFDESSTTLRPFYDSNGNKMGEVNMMTNRHTFPFANIGAIQARVLELPYGKENRLSLLIMLPYPNVSVKDMFNNLHNYSLDMMFGDIATSVKEFPDDEIIVYLPRFKIESELDLTGSLMAMGVRDLFDDTQADLSDMVNVPTYVSKISHKAIIEVTEEGTTASAATSAIFGNRIGSTRFEVNRPFGFMIVEKTTNTIAFSGSYNKPQLY